MSTEAGDPRCTSCMKVPDAQGRCDCDHVSSPESPWSEKNPRLQVAWDSVSMGLFKHCPRKYQLQLVEGWVPKRMAPPLSFGIKYHECLGHYTAKRTEGLSHEDALRSTVRFLLESARDLNEDGKVRTKFTLLRTVVWYLDEFKNHTDQTVVLKNGRPAVEVSFRIALPLISPDGRPYMLCGHIDRIVRNDQGEIFIRDHKHTAYALDERYFLKFLPDNQMSGYHFAGTVLLPEEPKGISIDAAQVGVTFSRFNRGRVHRTPKMVEEWVNDYTHWIRIAERCAEEGYWPMNDSACHHYGGCQFRDTCSRSPSVRQMWLEQDFKVEKWNPLENREG